MLAKLNANPRKQEEIDHWTKFVAALPAGSYLRGMFAGTEGYVENMIRSDFGYNPLPELERRRGEVAQEIGELALQRKSLQDTIREQEQKLATLERQIQRGQDTLESIRSQARRLLS